MPSFGKKSNNNLITCHSDLQILFKEVVKDFDCSVLCGARTLEEQMQLYAAGKSQLDGVNFKSKHQISDEQPLSLAVDVVPYPCDWEDIGQFRLLSAVVWNKWQELLINRGSDYQLEHGAGWRNFVDWPHWQLRKVR